jgi:hypothetical protein
MAQGDLFRQFVEQNGVLERALNANIINLEQRREILEDVYTREMNISEARKKLLKSDEKSLNVLKRIASVGKKVSSQAKENLETKRKIAQNDAFIEKLELKIIKARKDGNQALADALMTQRNKMKLDNQMNKVTLQQMRRSIPLLGRMGSVGAAISDTLVSIGGIFGSMFSILGAIATTLIKVGSTLVKLILAPLRKAFNVFLEMQSVVGNLAADIGLTAQESRNLLNNFASLTLAAMRYGGSMKDVATIIQTFSDVTSKNRLFNENEIGKLVELGLGTSLGVQGASELAASFDNIGLSLERTIELTDKARNMAARMNLNSGKVLKSYEGLVKSLTGIGFGRGLDNLTKLAAKATSIRFDIARSTESFTDQFFDLEKAVETAAKMQVLGGRFAQNFGDPMQLAFESMNDPAKLAERVTEVLKGSIVKSGGQFIIPPQERAMLRILAEQTGQDYKELTGTAIEQAKVMDKISALGKAGFNLMGMSEEDKMGIANLITLNKDNRYEIRMSDGTTKLLENITDKNQLKAVLDERKKNEDAARQRKNLLERLSLVVDRVMLGFSNVFNQLFGGTKFESFLQMVEKGSEKMAKFIMEDILGSNGLANGFETLVDKATKIFKAVEEIFTNKDKTFGQKIAETLKLLFKDVAVPIISEVLKFTIPILKAGIGKLLEIIGGALPSWLGGNKVKNYGLEMQSAAIADSDLLKTLYGKDGQSAIASQMSPDKGGSFLQGAGLYGKSLLGAKNIPGGVVQGLKGPFGKNAARLAKVGMKRGGQWGVKAAAMAAKRIPVLGSLASLGFAIYDAFEGDWTGAGLNLLSGAANLANIVAPGVGSAVSMGIDAGNAAREMGAFDDGVIYKDGSYAKFSKGDMVQFIDQAAYEKSLTGGGNSGGNGTIKHTGEITIRTNDGKAVTWDQLNASRNYLGPHIDSLLDSNKIGTGNYQNPYIASVKPLMDGLQA